MTGLGFGIISNSLAAQIVYGAQNEAAIKKQAAEAEEYLATRNAEISIHADGQWYLSQQQYFQSTLAPRMREAIPYVYTEMLARCVTLLGKRNCINDCWVVIECMLLVWLYIKVVAMYLHLPILWFEIYISSYHKDKRKEDTLFQKVSSRRCNYLFTYFKAYSRLYIATLILKRDFLYCSRFAVLISITLCLFYLKIWNFCSTNSQRYILHSYILPWCPCPI